MFRDRGDELIMDHQTRKVISSLKGHLDHSFSSTWHLDGRYFSTGNQDTTYRFQDIRNLNSYVETLRGYICAVPSLRFSSDGSFLALVELAYFICVFDAKEIYNQCQEIDRYGEIDGISFSLDTSSFVGIDGRTYGIFIEYN